MRMYVCMYACLLIESMSYAHKKFIFGKSKVRGRTFSQQTPTYRQTHAYICIRYYVYVCIVLKILSFFLSLFYTHVYLVNNIAKNTTNP